MGAPWMLRLFAPVAREGGVRLRQRASSFHLGVHAAAILIGCVLWGVALPPRAAAECPTSTINLPCTFPGIHVSTTAAAMDTVCIFYPPYANFRAGFDLPDGTISLWLDALSSSVAGDVRMVERYVLTGPPAGTPISFTVSMQLAATLELDNFSDIPISVSGTARLELDGVVIAQASKTRSCLGYGNCTTTGDLPTTLSASVQIPSGQEFEIASSLAGSVTTAVTFNRPGFAIIDGGVQFGNLPPGVTLAACHDVPTPVSQATWGSVKARYRP